MNVKKAGKRKVPPPPNVHKVVLAQQRAELRDYPGKVRRGRKAKEWDEMYRQAMAQKRK
jgi:hypothetical protein